MCQQYCHLLYCLPPLAVRNNRSKTPLRISFHPPPFLVFENGGGREGASPFATCGATSPLTAGYSAASRGGLSAAPLPDPPVLTVLVNGFRKSGHCLRKTRQC